MADRRFSHAMLLAALVLSGEALPAQVGETLLLQQPTISHEHIVFVYARDLWVVGREGGQARRLTSSAGSEFFPELSPDGKLVAFSGEYEGNADVYVIPVVGGHPRRLTWHPGGDYVKDWHPDGKHVLFSSGRDTGAPVHRLYLASLDGGTPEALAIPRAWHASYNRSGTRIAYTPHLDAFRSWKRYRGGRVTPIWIYDPETHEVEQIPHVDASDSYPAWAGDWVYFVSDRDNRMNLWRFDTGNKELEQITRFPEFDIRSLDAIDDAVVFEQAGAIHLHDPQTGKSRRLKIQVQADGLAALPRWQSVKGTVRSASIAPNGKRAVFEARGEILSVPREHGDVRNLTSSPGAHDRSPVWSPDGKRIAWFSDASGEYQLMVGDHLGREEPRTYELAPRDDAGEIGGFYYAPEWSPDGKHLLYRDKTNRIAYLTLESGKITEVTRSQGSLGVIFHAAVWSPDSQWICYERRNPQTTYDSLWLHEVATGKATRLTDGFGAAGSPAFAHDGKHLFFEASVDSGPQRFSLDMSASASRAPSNHLYCVVLAKDGKNPLAPKSDEGVLPDKKKSKDREDPSKKDADQPVDGGKHQAIADKEDHAEKKTDRPEQGGKTDESEKTAKQPAKEAAPSIDIEGIDQRILALPIGKGRYGNLETAGNKLFFLEYPTSFPSGEPTLKAFDFDSRKATTVAPGVNAYEISADSKSLLLLQGGAWSITNASGKDKKSLAINKARVRVDPAKEWPQILREVWRIQRDYFYDPAMHGIDWTAMWKRWSPFLEHVRHRSDLNVVISELIGELACGHQYVSGGQTPPTPQGVSVGLLGADFEVAKGRYRIRRIYRGQNWNPGLRSPLTEPGVDARTGDYLISVNGRPLRSTHNLYEAFENTAGKQVDLELAASADGSDARTVRVVPVADEQSLRQRSWVEENRRRVAERSGGRLAYIYMPNTGTAGMRAFDRDYYSQLDKEGLILDERYNGGGKVADYVIDVLSRKVRCYWMNREKWLGKTPFGTFEGPMVMVTNEMAGSGGDCMPWLFKRAGLGPTVGTRTWGGLVGISGYPVLMDGGRVTAASFGVMDTNGDWAVENVGVPPDHEVIEWPKQIIEGADPQLDKAIELALAELDKREPRRQPRYKPPARR